MCEWNKRHTDKAHTLPWMTQSLSSCPATCTQSHTRTNGETGLVQLTDSSSSVDCILHYTCVFSVLSSVPREQCFHNPVATDLYLTPLEVPSFDGKLADLLGGQHLKSLSTEPGALGRAVHCVLNIPPKWGWTRKSGEERTPPAIGCYLRLIDCYIKQSLNLLLYRLTSRTQEAWDTHRPNARNSCFGRLKDNTGIT